MAESPGVMGRLKRVERDVAALKRTVVQISEVLVDLTDRMDRGFKRVDDQFDTISTRLDRLITVTIEERTASTDRLRDIERRLSRLEERVGPAE
jgi:hypothetical protein